MNEKIIAITKKYLAEKSLEEFANGCGIEASRQSVHQWKEGEHIPSAMTLFAIMGSDLAQPWARAWAQECLSVLQQGARKRLVAAGRLNGDVAVDPSFK
ncbi:MAG: hypothetical protein CL609_23650 [Anaerolineaceae bacterium]|nr:hypothetical protein [Anaerolineaceae bacterium]